MRYAALYRLSTTCAIVIALGGLTAPSARAVSCPGSGAKVKVTVVNPTGSTSPSITVSGNSIGGEITCTDKSGSYTSSSFTVNANSSHTVTLPSSGGLVSGMWVHKIEVSSTTQEQYQQVPVLYDSGTAHGTVEWTYFPDVINVNVTGSSGTSMSDCPVDTVTNPATCDINEALLRANDNGTSRPVLVQFKVSPGALNKNLTISAADVTLDGTDSSGNPWIVGDPNAAAAGSQDTFPRVCEFPVSNGLRIEADDVTLIGLKLRQSTGGGNPSQHLLWLRANDPKGVLVKNVKLDAGADEDCFSIGGSCTEVSDVVKVPARGSAPGSFSLELVNAEVSGSIDKGIDLGDNSWTRVAKSWVHNNYEGNVSVGDVYGLVLDKSAVDRAGLRQSDDKAVSHEAHGLDVTDGRIDFDANLFRNNLGYGVRAAGLADVRPKNDWWCGNDADGFHAADAGGFVPSVTSFGGVAAAYNAGHGVSLEEDEFTAQSMNNQSAFLSNDECGLEPRSTIAAISAVSNQWRGSSPYPDTCPSAPGSVDVGTPLNPDDDEVDVFGLSPTNVILKGQTVRVLGKNFNAVAGNPLPGDGDCDSGVNTSGGGGGGQGDSCCLSTTRANVCGTGTRPDPQSGEGMCVEFKQGTGSWSNSVVKALSPAMIETEVPDTVFGCLGGSGEMIRVSKRKSNNIVSQDDTAYCTTGDPL